ncbi:winged helix-turn-helix domain-containing protein [Pararhodobacter sp. CCB-MM2]|uniref:winged helix-turn-helix domain-containing protein n=1 Tax=Pararhodobacter sp. CCB-MM2 TaxID=1786003 RepID=UPI0008375EE3|nr:crosslink repair DNA glycosylase YcaQ family protein [Pararhodobacter sp. CCB-MM2]
MTALTLSNRDARWLWLSSHGLSGLPTGPLDTEAMIHRLGFVQLDSIQIVARAHHHILWSRNQNYRERDLHRLMARDRKVFEHFTHDASVLPMEFLPMWRRQFRRMGEKISRSSWWGAMDPALMADVKRRVAEEGPLSTRAFDTVVEGDRAMWSRPPHKKALDYLWYTGELATSHREGFTKFYDLAEKVFPAELRDIDLPEAEQIDWLCHAALDRIGFGTLGEIRKFWDATEVPEVAAWAAAAPDLVPIEVETADGGRYRAVAVADIEARLAALEPPSQRLRVVNPFDPAIRDRVRLKKLFGFDYTVEMFVPAEKRQWGYYVFPLLEGDRFIGRLEARPNAARDGLEIQNLWLEPGIRPAKRPEKVEAELARLARLIAPKR